ncbi:sensor histidine kinase [Tenacibaculum soleae]|uniref:sensor histidine kinase n=1 Tax=Tenacibaculum soleae TaxID=447689 RepID=UPI002301D05D|nr:HAMP domain-containing sensor histidine kinase [Tenacibaculum soleae]
MEVITTEDKLKERIKELTCLYNVSSLIQKNDFTNVDELLKGIALSVKSSVRYPDNAFVEVETNDYTFFTETKKLDTIFIISKINVFDKIYGSIKIGYLKEEFSQNFFLEEEKQLLNKIAVEIGGLFERKQIEEKNILAKRQIERVDRLSILGEITAGIAHELNTPLANILGFSELLKERFENNKDAIEDLNKVVNSAVYSREVVKKLMFFSCEMPQQMEVVNCLPIIKEAISLLSPNFRKKNIENELSFNKENIQLKVDKIQLTQVVFNLIINAIYFSPVKGKIKTIIEETKEDVILKISDEGVGIPLSISESIFNPFFTTKPVGEGSGLGLSVVHGIVKSHKGTIKHVQNTPKGTTFVINFPKNKS